MYLLNHERSTLGLGAYGCDAPADKVKAAVTAAAAKTPPPDPKGPLARLLIFNTTGVLPGGIQQTGKVVAPAVVQPSGGNQGPVVIQQAPGENHNSLDAALAGQAAPAPAPAPAQASKKGR
jgi:hypothetical protein